MTTTALVPSPDVGALESLPVNEVDAALGHVWQAFGRRTVVDAWHIGRALRRVKETKPGRQFAPYCERIKLTRSWAYQLLKIADSSLAEVSCHRTVDGAVKALKAPEPAEPEPTPAPVEAAPVEAVEAAPAAVIDAVAEEATPTPAELRGDRLERLAIITEDIGDVDGKLVDAWAGTLRPAGRPGTRTRGDHQGAGAQDCGVRAEGPRRVRRGARSTSVTGS